MVTNNDPREAVESAIKLYMRANGLTMQDLADRLGVTQQAVSFAIKKGMGINTAKRWAKTFGRPLGRRGRVMGDGLFPELSSNWARHSWATAGILLDVPKETISRGMGHSNGIRVTDTYIDFDMRKVDEANRGIIDFILYGATTSSSPRSEGR